MRALGKAQRRCGRRNTRTRISSVDVDVRRRMGIVVDVVEGRGV